MAPVVGVLPSSIEADGTRGREPDPSGGGGRGEGHLPDQLRSGGRAENVVGEHGEVRRQGAAAARVNGEEMAVSRS